MGGEALMKVTAKELYTFKKEIKKNRNVWNPILSGSYLLLAMDLFSYYTAFALAFSIRSPNTNLENYLLHYSNFPIILVLISIFQIFDTYNTRDHHGIFSLASKSLLASIAIIPTIFIQDYLFGSYDLNYISGRGIALLFNIFFIFLTTAHRFIFSNFILLKTDLSNWIFIGNEDEYQVFEKDIKNNFRSNLINLTSVNASDAVTKFKQVKNLNGLIINDRNINNETLFHEVLKFRLSGGTVYSTEEFSEKFWLKLPVEILKKDVFAYSPGFNIIENSISMRIKRLIDFFGAIFLLILSMHISIIATLAIKITDGGPIFYIQKRTGLHGASFNVIKFRSMKVNSESNGAVWASKNDSRITWIGNIIRKTRIDEIPQFINVIKGEMSIIGPRPERPEIEIKLNKEISFYSFRHLVKPGITGWAQVLYPYGASIEDSLKKLEYDLFYIKNFSLALDISVVLKTIRIILFGKGR